MSADPTPRAVKGARRRAKPAETPLPEVGGPVPPAPSVVPASFASSGTGATVLATPAGTYDPWAAVLERIDDAAALAGLDPDVHRVLRLPDRVLEVAVPVRMDDGHVEVFLGWRIHHNTARGPAKGGSASIRGSRRPRWPRWPPT